MLIQLRCLIFTSGWNIKSRSLTFRQAWLDAWSWGTSRSCWCLSSSVPWNDDDDDDGGGDNDDDDDDNDDDDGGDDDDDDDDGGGDDGGDDDDDDDDDDDGDNKGHGNEWWQR